MIMQTEKGRAIVWLAALSLVTVAEGRPAGASAAAIEQAAAPGTMARVIADAPIYLKVGFTTPLRVAAAGTTLRVLSESGDWTQVQFQDPQFGTRTGWISSALIRRSQPNLEPIDLSILPPPDAAAAPQPAPPPAAPDASDEEPRREGVWFSVGLGLGSLGCEECDGREAGLSGGLAVGGTLNQHVLLGVGTTGFARSFDGDVLSVGTLDGRIRVYPSRRSGFFLNGGVGLGSLSYLGESEWGLGVMLGLGWDIRVGRNVSITPFWNGSAMENSRVDANFGQLGVGITIH